MLTPQCYPSYTRHKQAATRQFTEHIACTRHTYTRVSTYIGFDGQKGEAVSTSTSALANPKPTWKPSYVAAGRIAEVNETREKDIIVSCFGVISKWRQPNQWCGDNPTSDVETNSRPIPLTKPNCDHVSQELHGCPPYTTFQQTVWWSTSCYQAQELSWLR